MTRKPSPLVCAAFLICRKIVLDRQIQDVVLVGLPHVYFNHRFPCAATMGIFARRSSAQSDYQVEAKLQRPAGEIAWTGGLAEPWVMADPLDMYILKMTFNLIFPYPGCYDVVLLANGDELERQRFRAELGQNKQNA